MNARRLLLVCAAVMLSGSALGAPTRPAPVQLAARAALSVGTRVDARWGGSWWDAEVIATRAGLVKIHYLGWGSEWDEWLETARLRRAQSSVPFRNGRVGQSVEIEWRGSWWEGSILARRGESYRIHYTGWGSEWDEWVAAPRLRAAR